MFLQKIEHFPDMRHPSLVWIEGTVFVYSINDESFHVHVALGWSGSRKKSEIPKALGLLLFYQ